MLVVLCCGRARATVAGIVGTGAGTLLVASSLRALRGRSLSESECSYGAESEDCREMTKAHENLLHFVMHALKGMVPVRLPLEPDGVVRRRPAT